MEPAIIPPQISGKQNDLELKRIFQQEAEAEDCFQRIKHHLLHPAIWHSLAGFASGEFKLCTPGGQELSREAQTGDLVRIDLPGPGTKSGNGYDWVRIEDIECKENKDDAKAFFAMRLVVAKPANTTESSAAHFFAPGASSTFMVSRDGTAIAVSYHGRNEKPNTAADAVTDKARNLITGTMAMLGLSEMQWSALLKGLLWEERTKT